MAAERSVGPLAGVGQPGGIAHRRCRGAVAGYCGRIRRVDRVGAGWRIRGPGQRDGALAVHRRPHLVRDRGAPRTAWSCGVFLADGPLPRCRIHPPPSRRASCRDLGDRHRTDGHRPAADAGPGLGRPRVGERLGSGATAGEGTQNYLCAAQAAAVLLGLAITAVWSNGWWIDPAIGLAIAGIAVWQGIRTWRGHGCGC